VPHGRRRQAITAITGRPSIEPPRRILERPPIGRPRLYQDVQRRAAFDAGPAVQIGATTTSKPSNISPRSPARSALSPTSTVARSRPVFNSSDESVAEVFLVGARARRDRSRRVARHLCPDDPDVADLVAAIRTAAAESRTTLTAHSVCESSRAAEMAKRARSSWSLRFSAGRNPGKSPTGSRNVPNFWRPRPKTWLGIDCQGRVVGPPSQAICLGPSQDHGSAVVWRTTILRMSACL